MSQPPTSFWSQVRTEARATWWGRWRWLWLGVGLICFAVVQTVSWMDATDPSRDLQEVWEWLLVLDLGLVCWPAAWVGSDLLSTRFTRNPDPERAWRPREFLARFLGRLGPLAGMVGATSTAFTLASVSVDEFAGSWLSALRMLADWATLTSPFVAAALCYGAVASLASALARRPLRHRIAPFVAVLPSALLDRLERGEWFLDHCPSEAADMLRLFTTPFALAAIEHGVPLRPLLFAPEYMASGLWMASGILVGIALLAGLWIWWIAARRYRRQRRTMEGTCVPDSTTI